MQLQYHTPVKNDVGDYMGLHEIQSTRRIVAPFHGWTWYIGIHHCLESYMVRIMLQGIFLYYGPLEALGMYMP